MFLQEPNISKHHGSLSLRLKSLLGNMHELTISGSDKQNLIRETDCVNL